MIPLSSSYFTKNFLAHYSFCKSVILCRYPNVKPLKEAGHAGHTGPNSQLNICEKSSFTTIQKGHSRFDGHSPLKLTIMSNITNIGLKIICAYLGSNWTAKHQVPGIMQQVLWLLEHP